MGSSKKRRTRGAGTTGPALAQAKRKKGGFGFAKWRRSAAVAPCPESDSVGKKMASREAFGEEGDREEAMETEITPEPNGT